MNEKRMAYDDNTIRSVDDSVDTAATYRTDYLDQQSHIDENDSHNDNGPANSSMNTRLSLEAIRQDEIKSQSIVNALNQFILQAGNIYRGNKLSVSDANRLRDVADQAGLSIQVVDVLIEQTANENAMIDYCINSDDFFARKMKEDPQLSRVLLEKGGDDSEKGSGTLNVSSSVWRLFMHKIIKQFLIEQNMQLADIVTNSSDTRRLYEEALGCDSNANDKFDSSRIPRDYSEERKHVFITDAEAKKARIEASEAMVRSQKYRNTSMYDLVDGTSIRSHREFPSLFQKKIIDIPDSRDDDLSMVPCATERESASLERIDVAKSEILDDLGAIPYATEKAMSLSWIESQASDNSSKSPVETPIEREASPSLKAIDSNYNDNKTSPAMTVDATGRNKMSAVKRRIAMFENGSTSVEPNTNSTGEKDNESKHIVFPSGNILETRAIFEGKSQPKKDDRKPDRKVQSKNIQHILDTWAEKEQENLNSSFKKVTENHVIGKNGVSTEESNPSNLCLKAVQVDDLMSPKKIQRSFHRDPLQGDKGPSKTGGEFVGKPPRKNVENTVKLLTSDKSDCVPLRNVIGNGGSNNNDKICPDNNLHSISFALNHNLQSDSSDNYEEQHQEFYHASNCEFHNDLSDHLDEKAEDPRREDSRIFGMAKSENRTNTANKSMFVTSNKDSELSEQENNKEGDLCMITVAQSRKFSDNTSCEEDKNYFNPVSTENDIHRNIAYANSTSEESDGIPVPPLRRLSREESIGEPNVFRQYTQDDQKNEKESLRVSNNYCALTDLSNENTWIKFDSNNRFRDQSCEQLQHRNKKKYNGVVESERHRKILSQVDFREDPNHSVKENENTWSSFESRNIFRQEPSVSHNLPRDIEKQSIHSEPKNYFESLLRSKSSTSILTETSCNERKFPNPKTHSIQPTGEMNHSTLHNPKEQYKRIHDKGKAFDAKNHRTEFRDNFASNSEVQSRGSECLQKDELLGFVESPSLLKNYTKHEHEQSAEQSEHLRHPNAFCGYTDKHSMDQSLNSVEETTTSDIGTHHRASYVEEREVTEGNMHEKRRDSIIEQRQLQGRGDYYEKRHNFEALNDCLAVYQHGEKQEEEAPRGDRLNAYQGICGGNEHHKHFDDQIRREIMNQREENTENRFDVKPTTNSMTTAYQNKERIPTTFSEKEKVTNDIDEDEKDLCNSHEVSWPITEDRVDREDLFSQNKSAESQSGLDRGFQSPAESTHAQSKPYNHHVIDVTTMKSTDGDSHIIQHSQHRNKTIHRRDPHRPSSSIIRVLDRPLLDLDDGECLDAIEVERQNTNDSLCHEFDSISPYTSDPRTYRIHPKPDPLPDPSDPRTYGIHPKPDPLPDPSPKRGRRSSIKTPRLNNMAEAPEGATKEELNLLNHFIDVASNDFGGNILSAESESRVRSAALKVGLTSKFVDQLLDKTMKRREDLDSGLTFTTPQENSFSNDLQQTSFHVQGGRQYQDHFVHHHDYAGDNDTYYTAGDYSRTTANQRRVHERTYDECNIWESLGKNLNFLASITAKACGVNYRSARDDASSVVSAMSWEIDNVGTSKGRKRRSGRAREFCDRAGDSASIHHDDQSQCDRTRHVTFAIDSDQHGGMIGHESDIPHNDTNTPPREKITQLV